MLTLLQKQGSLIHNLAFQLAMDQISMLSEKTQGDEPRIVVHPNAPRALFRDQLTPTCGSINKLHYLRFGELTCFVWGAYPPTPIYRPVCEEMHAAVVRCAEDDASRCLAPF